MHNSFQGIRFYLEYGSKENKRNGTHNGNIVAVDSTSKHSEYWYTDTNETKRYHTIYDAIGVVPSHPFPNCDMLASTSVSQEYLTEQCKRISRKEAMNIHPAMFSSVFFSEHN